VQLTGARGVVVEPGRAPVVGRVAMAALGWAALVVGCGADGPPAGPAIEPRLHALQTQVFAVSCALSQSCHAGPAPKEGLDLSASLWSRIVNRPSAQVPEQNLVVPGDPEASYLFEKVSRPTPARGVRMPNAGPPLDPATLGALRSWILDGARDD
jgi:hypothetical protein